MGWFEKDLITNFSDWQQAFQLQTRAEKEERQFLEDFIPKLLTYLGVGLVMVMVLVLLVPKKSG